MKIAFVLLAAFLSGAANASTHQLTCSFGAPDEIYDTSKNLMSPLAYQGHVWVDYSVMRINKNTSTAVVTAMKDGESVNILVTCAPTDGLTP